MGQEQARSVRDRNETGDGGSAQAVHHQGGYRHETPQTRIFHRRLVVVFIVDVLNFLIE